MFGDTVSRQIQQSWQVPVRFRFVGQRTASTLEVTGSGSRASGKSDVQTGVGICGMGPFRPRLEGNNNADKMELSRTVASIGGKSSLKAFTGKMSPMFTVVMLMLIFSSSRGNETFSPSCAKASPMQQANLQRHQAGSHWLGTWDSNQSHYKGTV